MKITKKLLASIVFLIASIVACAMACYAWFLSNGGAHLDTFTSDLDDVGVNVEVTAYFLSQRYDGPSVNFTVTDSHVCDANKDKILNGEETMLKYNTDPLSATALLLKLDCTVKDPGDYFVSVYTPTRAVGTTKLNESGGVINYKGKLSNVVHFHPVTDSVTMSGDVPASASVTLSENKFTLVRDSELLNENALANITFTEDELSKTVYLIMDYDSTLMSILYGDIVADEGVGALVDILFDDDVKIKLTQGTRTIAADPLPDIQVTRIAMSVNEATMSTGSTLQLIANVYPANASNRAITWSSAHPNIATVSEGGLVTAVATGTTTITAQTSNEVTATCTINVSNSVIAVESVTLNHSTLNMYTGDTEALTATVLPANATNKTVTWTSDNETVATVSSNGRVTALSSGTATITASTGEMSATCTVSVTTRKYTVTFDANGHGTAPAASEVIAGNPVSPPTPPTAAGYTFGGWYKDTACTDANRFNFSTEVIEADITLYAKWTETSVSDTSDGDYTFGGANTPDDMFAVSGTNASGSTVTLGSNSHKIIITLKLTTAQPFSVTVEASSGYAMPVKIEATSGSVTPSGAQTIVALTNDNVNRTGTINYTVNSDGVIVLEIYRGAAHNAIVRSVTVHVGEETTSEYTITFNKNGHGTAPSAQTTTNGKLTSLPNMSATGYTFGGWYLNSAGTGNAVTTSTTFTENTTVYAKWTINTYTVTFDTDGGSSVASQTVNYNAKATRPADPTKSGYTFDNWYTTASGSTVFNFNTAITADTTVYAKWTAVSSEYTVTFDANGHGTAPSAQTTTNGKLTSLPTITGVTGYTFDGWYLNSAGTGSAVTTSTTFTENTTVYAKWTSTGSGGGTTIEGTFFARENEGNITSGQQILALTSNVATVTASKNLSSNGTRIQTSGDIFEFTFASGYSYTVTINASSSGSSSRTLTLSKDGTPLTTETVKGTSFVDKTFTVTVAGTYTFNSSGNINIASITIVATPVQ